MNSYLLYCFTPFGYITNLIVWMLFGSAEFYLVFGYLTNLIVWMLSGSAEFYLVSELVQLKDPFKFLIVCLYIMRHLKDWNILDLFLNKKPAGKASNLLSNAIKYGHDATGICTSKKHCTSKHT